MLTQASLPIKPIAVRPANLSRQPLRCYTNTSINRMSSDERPVTWVGGSRKDLCALPEEVRQFFGHAIHMAQHGLRHAAAKPMQGFGSAGVLEVVERDESGTYRAVYTVLFPEAVFVLHCFQKKSMQGIATPREDMDLIRTRLKAVETRIKEQRNEKISR